MRRARAPRNVWSSATLTALALALAPLAASAQQGGERAVRQARSGIALWVGTWRLQDHQTPSGATESTTPTFEGYFARGLDLHLVLENSISFWRQSQKVTVLGGPAASPFTQRVTGYVVPQFTSVRAYPFTRPTARVEPYLRGGVGFAIGIEDRSGPSGGPLDGSGSGTSFVPGFGLTGGSGVEWRATHALGLGAGVRYQYVQFFNEGVAGSRIYKGAVFEGGVTYRFQYR